jgi:hypothetical protein
VESVKLKNGSEELKGLVIVVMASLRHLMAEQPLALYELAMKARDKGHVIFGNLDKPLKEMALLEHGNTIHSCIKNIVLSAVEGDGFDMCLVNPIKEKGCRRTRPSRLSEWS